jgi:pimeloyl-ACP methyl ester carboxylesterase
MSKTLRFLLVALLLLPGAATFAGPLEDAPSRFALLDGAKVHYKSVGKGDFVVVLVHGWTCDLTFWSAQTGPLAARGRVLALDLPGHGKSDAPEVEYTMDLFARAVEAVLADAKAKKAVLVGHSMGTPVVRQVYRRSPAKVTALVAVDGALRPFFTLPEQKDGFLAKFDGEKALENRTKMVESMWSAETTPEVKEKVRTTMLAALPRVASSAMRGMLDDDVWSEDAISVPLLLLLSSSPHWDEGYEAFVRKLSPKARFVRIPGTGHFLMLEKPAEFNAALLAFLGKVPRA